jgi:hypothetical protein
MPRGQTQDPHAAQITQRARIAALTRWSREDPRAQAQRAQAGLLDKFRREVLEEFPGLQEPELSRRAEARRRLHMERLSFKASRARTLKAQAVDDG